MEKALQAVHNSNVFTSFVVAEGCLQLAMAEDDIKKTAFRAGFSGLHEFIHMPFGLPNASSSFFRVMGQCLADYQFITLLQYLDNICMYSTY